MQNYILDSLKIFVKTGRAKAQLQAKIKTKYIQQKQQTSDHKEKNRELTII